MAAGNAWVNGANEVNGAPLPRRRFAGRGGAGAARVTGERGTAAGATLIPPFTPHTRGNAAPHSPLFPPFTPHPARRSLAPFTVHRSPFTVVHRPWRPPCLPQCLTQQKLHLRVEGAEVVGGPALQGGMQRWVETEKDRLAFTHESGGSGVE